MELKIKDIRLSAGFPVVLLDKDTAAKIGVHPKGRVSLRKLKNHDGELSSVVDITEGILKKNEIALSEEIKKMLGVRNGQKIEVNLAPLPESINFILKKLHGKRLSQKEIEQIILDVVNNSLSEAEIALFVSSMYRHGMNISETTFLINSIVKHGNTLKLNRRKIVDKHSIGGVPGNRTTPIVVSICASAGLTIPKNSSRAITSAAGTADVIETIANVSFGVNELKKIIQKTNACMVWGGALNLVPADSKIIAVEKMLKIDPEAQLLASIMSKKLAVGSKYVLIDIPYGKGAKVSKKKAEILKKKFEKLGRIYKIKLECVLTNGKNPIGNGVGPALELKDVIRVLDPSKIGPKDLEEKSIFLAGKIFELCGKCKKGKGEEFARELLHSGKAFKKFKEIIKAQGGKLKELPLAKYSKHILSTKNGKISDIKNKEISTLARILGCPADKYSGLYLHKKTGEYVKKGEPIVTFYSELRSRMRQAKRYYRKKIPIAIK